MRSLPAPAKYMIGFEPDPIIMSLQADLAQMETTRLGHILYWGSMDIGIQSAWPQPPRIAGRALTVEIPASCSVMLHHAIGLAQPGDVLVIDRRGDRTYACLGGGVAKAAKAKGIVGAIIDGPCTDVEELAALEFPVWCRGRSATTTRMADLGGRAHVPVSCGGVAVLSGDMIVADEDGVFAMAPDLALDVMKIADERAVALKARSQAAARGTSLGDRSGASRFVEQSLKG